jgi:hypothetical protein
VGIVTASRGLLEIIVFMLILAILRTRVNWKAVGESLRTRVMAEPKTAE